MIVRRVVAGGQLIGAQPLDVLAVVNGTYWAGLAPGTRVVDESRYCAWLRGEGERRDAVDAVARGEWTVDHHVWRWNIYVRRLVPGAWWTATAVFDAEQQFRHWYVDFHRPLFIRGGMVDVYDLHLDAVIGPSGDLRWKDEARAEVALLAERRSAPFDGWLPDPGGVRSGRTLPYGWDRDVVVRWLGSDVARGRSGADA